MHDPTRRRLLTGVGVLVAGTLLPTGAFAGPSFPQWPGPYDVRQIWLTRPETRESGVFRYFDGLSVLLEPYAGACRILRDVRADVIGEMDMRLLDLIFCIQKWLVDYGIDLPLHILSGLRTARTNSRTEGAARNSEHLYARAADIRIPGIPSDYLAQLAALLQAGGVGIYLDKGFVHIDVGRLRRWVRGRPPGHKNQARQVYSLNPALPGATAFAQA
jgi:uncharacterized protein YcbK (DUF882 family)